MLFSQDRVTLRKMYFDCWQKAQGQQTVEPLEQQVVAVILDHPEYHTMLAQPDRYLDQDYLPEFGETNPFLHMGLHLSIREQVSNDRPHGIQACFLTLQSTGKKPHDIEHDMIDCLAESLWLAQRHNTTPDETAYLKALQTLVKT